MVKGILTVLIILFAVSGLCEFIHSVRLFFILPEKERSSLCVIRLQQGKAVQQLRFVLHQSHWLGSLYADKVVAISDGIESEELDVCKNLIESSDIVLCSSETFEYIVENI